MILCKCFETRTFSGVLAALLQVQVVPQQQGRLPCDSKSVFSFSVFSCAFFLTGSSQGVGRIWPHRLSCQYGRSINMGGSIWEEHEEEVCFCNLSQCVHFFLFFSREKIYYFCFVTIYEFCRKIHYFSE